MGDRSIGVVLATYNGSRFIKEQIESILKQSMKPDLIVVVDDGSTDNTPEIIRSYAEEHSSIRLFQHVENVGYIRNFEKGISLCHTDYVALCDQDDVWMPNKLEKCFRKLSSNNNGGLCYDNAGLMYEDGTSLNVSLWELSEL